MTRGNDFFVFLKVLNLRRSAVAGFTFMASKSRRKLFFNKEKGNAAAVKFCILQLLGCYAWALLYYHYLRLGSLSLWMGFFFFSSAQNKKVAPALVQIRPSFMPTVLNRTDISADSLTSRSHLASHSGRLKHTTVSLNVPVGSGLVKNYFFVMSDWLIFSLVIYAPKKGAKECRQ